MPRLLHPNRKPQRRERLWNTAEVSSEISGAVFSPGTADRLCDLAGEPAAEPGLEPASLDAPRAVE